MEKKKNKEIKTILGNRGYAIIKDKFDSKELRQCRKELTVKPNIYSPIEGVAVQSFPVFLESSKKLYLPRHYGYKKFGEPDKNKLLDDGFNIDIEFAGNLRPEQLPVVDKFKKACIEKGGGLISLPCGFGKTIIALKIITELKKKTIIIVHKEFLLNQWKERIKEFIPTANIGLIQAKTIDIKNKDIVLAMLQSISMKDYPDDMFDCFQFSIIDECHHIAAEVFSKSLPKIACLYNLGLSATPKRKDGLSKVFEWYLGDMVYQVKKRESEKVNVEMVYFDCDDPQYGQAMTMYNGKVCLPQMITYICNLKQRNDAIIKMVEEILEEKKNDTTRKILILSDRKDQLKYIKETVEKNEICTAGYYVGGMKESALKESEEKTLMLATFSMAAEGFDCAALNTLILANSKSDIEQSVGRILRQKKDARLFDPLIIDIIDDYSSFGRQAIKRKKFYKKNNYIIVDKIYGSNDQVIDDDNEKTDYKVGGPCLIDD